MTQPLYFANQILNNLKLKINPAMVINRKMTDNILYPNLTNQFFILAKKAIFLSDLIGIFTKAFSRMKNNTLHIKPAKLGIRYSSSTKCPISNKEQQNKVRQPNPSTETIGLKQRNLEEIDERASSIIIDFSTVLSG